MVTKLQKENDDLRAQLDRLRSQVNQQGYDWVGSAPNTGPVGIGPRRWCGSGGGGA